MQNRGALLSCVLCALSALVLCAMETAAEEPKVGDAWKETTMAGDRDYWEARARGDDDPDTFEWFLLAFERLRPHLRRGELVHRHLSSDRALRHLRTAERRAQDNENGPNRLGTLSS